MLKRIKLLIAASLSVFVLIPSMAVYAALDVTGVACQGIEDSAACKDAAAGQTDNPLCGADGILTKAISIIPFVAGIIAVIVLIVAGIRFATSQGNAQTVGAARSTIIYAVVGLVVAVLAQALVQLVLGKL